MLRERPDLRHPWYSPLTFGVLDSKCCDISWTFEFLPEHPSKRTSSDAGPFKFFEVCLVPFPTVFHTADVGGGRNKYKICDGVLSGFGSLAGLDRQALLGSDIALRKVIEMIFYTNKSKPLSLPWGRAPRLESGVIVSTHVVRDGRSGTLVGQGSAVIMTADANYPPWTLVSLRMVASVLLYPVRGHCGSGLSSEPL
nr:hypothetical protein [Tanacetum cinerariifolium]